MKDVRWHQFAVRIVNGCNGLPSTVTSLSQITKHIQEKVGQTFDQSHVYCKLNKHNIDRKEGIGDINILNNVSVCWYLSISIRACLEFNLMAYAIWHIPFLYCLNVWVDQMRESEPTLSGSCCTCPGSYRPIGRFQVIGRIKNQKLNVPIKAMSVSIRAVSNFDGHVKLSILNFPNNLKLANQMVGVRACATSNA